MDGLQKNEQWTSFRCADLYIIVQSNKITRHTILFEACMCINACSDAQFVQIKNVGLIAEFLLVAVKCHKTVLVCYVAFKQCDFTYAQHGMKY